MAPEVLANQRYSNKADVYSFGMVMWECCARQVPFEGLNGVQAGEHILEVTCQLRLFGEPMTGSLGDKATKRTSAEQANTSRMARHWHVQLVGKAGFATGNWHAVAVRLNQRCTETSVLLCHALLDVSLQRVWS
jgi:serine/threonine protein kinase